MFPPNSLARKRTGDAEIGGRPTPEKNIETMPCWGKNSPEKCLVDLGRDTRTNTQPRRLVRKKGASWSLSWPSGANFIVHMQFKCILCVSMCLCDCCVLVFLHFWESIKQTTRLDRKGHSAQSDLFWRINWYAAFCLLLTFLSNWGVYLI